MQAMQNRRVRFAIAVGIVVAATVGGWFLRRWTNERAANQLLPEMVQVDDLEGVCWAIAAGADVNAVDEHRKTPLHHAAKRGNEQCVLALIRGGANVHAKDGEGHTPLHYAAGEGATECVSALLAADADVNSNAFGDRKSVV